MLRKIARWNSLPAILLIAFALLHWTVGLQARPFATQQPMMLAQLATGNLDCTGGTTITTSGVNRIHTFNSSSSLVCTGSGTATYLVVGGGGAGANGVDTGGGGGGAVVTGSTTISGTIVVTVGAGGSGASSTAGSASSLGAIATANGGGVGGGDGANGGNGASGGGGGGGATTTGGTATAGFAGGAGTNFAPGRTAGGGGGAGGAGTAGNGTTGGAGGAGTSNSTSGAAVIYGAGGGGGTENATGGSGAGGSSCGGAGGPGAGSTAAGAGQAGLANRGCGGGGASRGSGSSGGAFNGGDGGSGVVIVSYNSIRNPLSLGAASAVGASTTVAMTGGVNIVAGDTVVVSVGHLTAAGTTVSSVSDGTNTYSRATSGNDGATQQAELWYKINAAAVTGPTITATFSGSVASRVIGAARIAGGLTSLDVAPAGVASTGSTAPTVSTGTLASSNAEIVIGFLYVATTPTVTEGTGFTQIYNENASAVTNHLAYQVTTATTTVAYSPTTSVASNNIIMVAAFK